MIHIYVCLTLLGQDEIDRHVCSLLVQDVADRLAGESDLSSFSNPLTCLSPKIKKSRILDSKHLL